MVCIRDFSFKNIQFFLISSSNPNIFMHRLQSSTFTFIEYPDDIYQNLQYNKAHGAKLLYPTMQCMYLAFDFLCDNWTRSSINCDKSVFWLISKLNWQNVLKIVTKSTKHLCYFKALDTTTIHHDEWYLKRQIASVSYYYFVKIEGSLRSLRVCSALWEWVVTVELFCH